MTQIFSVTVCRPSTKTLPPCVLHVCCWTIPTGCWWQWRPLGWAGPWGCGMPSHLFTSAASSLAVEPKLQPAEEDSGLGAAGHWEGPE